MDITFDNTCTSLIATYTINADGTGTAVYFFDGFEITAAEYGALEIASLDRYFATHTVEG